MIGIGVRDSTPIVASTIVIALSVFQSEFPARKMIRGTYSTIGAGRFVLITLAFVIGRHGGKRCGSTGNYCLCEEGMEGSKEGEGKRVMWSGNLYNSLSEYYPITFTNRGWLPENSYSTVLPEIGLGSCHTALGI